MKTGTRIEVNGWDFSGNVTWEAARIGRQPKGGYPVTGYYCVVFDDGSKLAVHESRFRVVDNRAAQRNGGTMMAYYGLYQHERGTMTTLNGKPLDRLHKFKSKLNRDAWTYMYPRASAISPREARELARRFYGLKLQDLAWMYDDEDDEQQLEAHTGQLGSEDEAASLGRL